MTARSIRAFLPEEGRFVRSALAFRPFNLSPCDFAVRINELPGNSIISEHREFDWRLRP
jgi:hypothetical protein